MTNEKSRKKFEAWLLIDLPISYHAEFIWRNTNGDYARRYSQDAWEGWQAAQADQAETIALLQLENQKLRELVKNLRPKYGDVGSRDIDVSETQRLFDEVLGERK